MTVPPMLNAIWIALRRAKRMPRAAAALASIRLLIATPDYSRLSWMESIA